MTLPLVTYRGCVNTWECDQWGHQNVRFYIAKASDAQAALCAEIGLTPAYLRERGLMVRTVRDRVLFKRELHAGDAVSIRSGIREAQGAAIRHYSVLANDETGTRSAVFETEAHLVDAGTGKAVKLPAAVTSGAMRLAGTHASHPPPPPPEGPRAPVKDAPRSLLTHRGAFDSWERDESGWTPPRFQIGRLAQAATRLIEHLGLSKDVLLDRKLGNAALDYSIEYRAPLRPGQTIDVHSGVLEVGRKVLRIYHHLIDFAQGEVATQMEVALVFFDLTARKSVPMPQEIVAAAHDLMRRPSTRDAR